MKRVSFADSGIAETSTEDATQETVSDNITSQQMLLTRENTHCLVVEEEHDMSQYLTNCGYQCYRLTHRNADSGAANGLLTKIKNREFCVLMIHLPVKKKDIRENRYHAHLRNLVSWTRQAHLSELPVLWIGPLGNAWHDIEIRNMQKELNLFNHYFRKCMA